ncbi:MAG: hypothetical protein J1E35_07430 [Lachnospiraceae bacterium]|nr:hypothetical protein [Lachnospiraceae bacterium]
MIVWKEALYVAGIPPRKQKRIIRAIKRRRLVRGVYLITAPSNRKNCLEYMKANQILQPYYRKREIKVYGLAGSEEAAQELAASMVCGAYAATGSFAVIDYLERRRQDKAGDTA